MNPNFFNLSKRKKRDILSELLADRPSEGIISKREISALVKAIHETSHVESIHIIQPEKKKKISSRKKNKTEKKRTSCYLSVEVFRNLENVTKEIRSAMPENLQSKVTKSHIVNQSIALMLEEYKNRRENSRLVRSILQVN